MLSNSRRVVRATRATPSAKLIHRDGESLSMTGRRRCPATSGDGLFAYDIDAACQFRSSREAVRPKDRRFFGTCKKLHVAPLLLFLFRGSPRSPQIAKQRVRVCVETRPFVREDGENVGPLLWKTQLSQRGTIPAFLSIDVESDGFQLSRENPPAWCGYSAMFNFSEELRASLTERSGAAPKFGWYFHTDPQIAAVSGRPDHVLAEDPQRIAHLEAQGDYFGVHAHPIRWCAERRAWIHDFAIPSGSRTSHDSHLRPMRAGPAIR